MERISKVNRSPANIFDLDEAIFDFLVFALSLLLQDAWMESACAARRTKIYTATSVGLLARAVYTWKVIINNNELCIGHTYEIFLFSRTSHLHCPSCTNSEVFDSRKEETGLLKLSCR